MAQSQVGGAGSVSKVSCVAQVVGKGEVKVSLYRHLAPLTVNAILRDLPIESRVNVQPAMDCLFTTVRVGVEKRRADFARGDVAFLASSGLICFFLKNATSDRPLNPIGKVESGMELLDSLGHGSVIRLSQEPPESPP
ncbi:MAG TPA: cyclophilin-like family protein [Nitrososphaerales archaeon]|nr:cyclophilin-like family protein [Nitrososphaerales archaeon]